MISLAQERLYFAPLQRLIQAGDIEAARAFLEKDSHSTMVLYPLFVAICDEQGQLVLWEAAISRLKEIEPSSELLFALEKAIGLSRTGDDSLRLRRYLQMAQEVSQSIEDEHLSLKYMAIYANRLLLDGYPEKAEPFFRDVIRKAQQCNDHLLVISQSVILSGILMNQQRWKEAIVVSIILEKSAEARNNPIAVACAILTRASSLYAQELDRAALKLLFDTGRTLYQKGHVAALNLVKARLTELRMIMGVEKFELLSENL